MNEAKSMAATAAAGMSGIGNIKTNIFRFKIYIVFFLSFTDYLRRQKLLEDLITDNNAKNLKQHVEFLTSIFAITSSASILVSDLSDSLSSGKIISVESLLDAIVILYDECSTSSLRREKTVSDFVETSKIDSSLSFYLYES